ncbi:hypothetical protein Nmel_010558 [Mimus melanotis]
MVNGTKSAFGIATTPNVHTSVNGKGIISCCTNPGSMEELTPFKTFAPTGSSSGVLM